MIWPRVGPNDRIQGALATTAHAITVIIWFQVWFAPVPGWLLFLIFDSYIVQSHTEPFNFECVAHASGHFMLWDHSQIMSCLEVTPCLESYHPCSLCYNSHKNMKFILNISILLPSTIFFTHNMLILLTPYDQTFIWFRPQTDEPGTCLLICGQHGHPSPMDAFFFPLFYFYFSILFTWSEPYYHESFITDKFPSIITWIWFYPSCILSHAHQCCAIFLLNSTL